MIGNLNEISLFTQAYFTMLTTIHESKNYQGLLRDCKNRSFAAQKVYESYLQMVAAQVEAPEGGEVPYLDGQVGDLITADIQLHQAGHVPHLLGEAHLVIM